VDILNSKSKKEADKIYSNIQKSEETVNKRMGTVQEYFEKKAQLLGYEKVKFQSREIKKLIDQLNRIRGNIQYKDVEHQAINMSLKDLTELEKYSLDAEKILLADTSVRSEMTGTSVISLVGAAGIYGSVHLSTSGFLASTTSALLGPSAVINGNLGVIGGGGFISSALGLGGNAVRIGAMTVGVAVIVPVALGGVYLKRNKNRRCLERAHEDLQRANNEIAKIHEKCDIIYKVSSSLDLYQKMFYKFRQKATTLHDQIITIEKDYKKANSSGNIDEIEREQDRILKSIQMSINFLKNSKLIIEIDVLQKVCDDLPTINDLFNSEILNFDNSLN